MHVISVIDIIIFVFTFRFYYIERVFAHIYFPRCCTKAFIIYRYSLDVLSLIQEDSLFLPNAILMFMFEQAFQHFISFHLFIQLFAVTTLS